MYNLSMNLIGSKMSYKLCGIDEAGRGPLAGNLVIAGSILNSGIDGLMDSKKLSEKKREMLYEEIIKKLYIMLWYLHLKR